MTSTLCWGRSMDAKSLIREDEGVVFHLYECTSHKKTIGIGHNVTDCGLPRVAVELLLKRSGNMPSYILEYVLAHDLDLTYTAVAPLLVNGINAHIAEEIFDSDIAIAQFELIERVAGYSHLSEVRQAVLLNMMFTMGWPVLSDFDQFLKALNIGDYNRASVEMLDSLWAKRATFRAERLSRMMVSDRWPS